MDFLRRKNKESRLCVLHIDDSRWVRIPVSVLLRRHFGMRVIEADNGAQGLVLAERERPDLIILDVMMPQMDGFDTLAKLKENMVTKAIPVLMCTARDIVREVNMAVRLGAVGYLTKPIEEDILVSKVEDILRVTGKWGNIVGRNNFEVPPDLRNDLVIPKAPITETAKTPNTRFCKSCNGPLEFIPQYDAWYCRSCRKYPELES